MIFLHSASSCEELVALLFAPLQVLPRYVGLASSFAEEQSFAAFLIAFGKSNTSYSTIGVLQIKVSQIRMRHFESRGLCINREGNAMQP